jgi:DHA2 family multidrug resistance protein
VVNTIVARHQQLHRNELAHSVNPGNVNLQNQLHAIQQFLSSQGTSASLALSRAYDLINLTLNGQARLWSYVDDFRYMALVCFGCIPIVFMLKKAVGKGGVSAGH